MPEYSFATEKEAVVRINVFINSLPREYAYAVESQAKLNLDVHGTTDTGKLKRSIKMREVPNGFEVFSDAVHALPVEYGTLPHFPPVKALKGWARRKLGDEGAAYAVQQKIGKKGTPAQPYFEPAIESAFDIAFETARRKAFG